MAALSGALIVVLLLIIFLLRRRKSSDNTVLKKVEKAHEKTGSANWSNNAKTVF